MTEHAKTAAAWVRNLDRMIAAKIDRADMHADNASDREGRSSRARATDYAWHEDEAIAGECLATQQAAIVRLVRMGFIS